MAWLGSGGTAAKDLGEGLVPKWFALPPGLAMDVCGQRYVKHLRAIV